MSELLSVRQEGSKAKDVVVSVRVACEEVRKSECRYESPVVLLLGTLVRT